MKSLQKISLDFGKDTAPITVFAKQYDAETRFIEITPLHCSEIYNIGEGVTPRLQLTKADGYTVMNDVEIANGVIFAELTPQILATSGIAVAEIALYAGTSLLSSQIFYIDVKPSAINPKAPESAPEYNALITATAKAKEATKKINGLTVTAQNGDTAAVTKTEKDGSIELNFTIPKGKNGKDYILTDGDKQYIAKDASQKAVAETFARTIYINAENGRCIEGTDFSCQFDTYKTFGEVLDDRVSDEYGAGAWQGFRFKIVDEERIVDANYKDGVFVGYDAETDTLYSYDGENVTKTENYIKGEPSGDFVAQENGTAKGLKIAPAETGDAFGENDDIVNPAIIIQDSLGGMAESEFRAAYQDGILYFNAAGMGGGAPVEICGVSTGGRPDSVATNGFVKKAAYSPIIEFEDLGEVNSKGETKSLAHLRDSNGDRVPIEYEGIVEILKSSGYKCRFVYMTNRPLLEGTANAEERVIVEITTVANGIDEYGNGYLFFGGVLDSQTYLRGYMYAYEPVWKTVRLTEQTLDEPCLIEGTPINMADGTAKAVEDVRAGDLVQSYDPANGAMTAAVVIDAYVTGYARKFSTYSFSDGRYLTIYGQHSIYNKSSGTTKDIRKSNRNDRIVNIDGELVQWCATHDMFHHGEKKRRYNIVTSNNLYFANGILLGHKPFSKLQRVLDAHITVSEEIRAVWQRDCDDYNNYNAFLRSPEFHAEMKAPNQDRARAEHIIAVNKKRLADSDYKAQKHVEGLLTDAEWSAAKNQRAVWRKEINDNETALEENSKCCREIVAKYRGGKSSRAIFEDCCARDNALFETVKAYFAPKNKNMEGDA